MSRYYVVLITIIASLSLHSIVAMECDDESPDFALYQAICAGDSDGAQKALNDGAYVDDSSIEGVSNIYVAARFNNPEMVCLLLRFEPDLNTIHKQAGAPLHNVRYPETVRLLCQAGADPNINHPILGTPLHWAAIKGNVHVMDALIDAQANIEARRTGSTPLSCAVRSRKIAAVRCLLRAGADIEGDRRKLTSPLFIAFEIRHAQIARHLLAHGASLKGTSGLHSPLHYVLAHMAYYQSGDIGNLYDTLIVILGYARAYGIEKEIIAVYNESNETPYEYALRQRMDSKILVLLCDETESHEAINQEAKAVKSGLYRCSSMQQFVLNREMGLPVDFEL